MIPNLGPRTKQIEALVLSGLANADIAQQLGIHLRTAKHHVGLLFDFYQVRNRVELAIKLGVHEGGTNPAGFARLSKTERKSSLLVSEGLTNIEIAERLGTSPQTVKNTLRRAFDKIGSGNRFELALYINGLKQQKAIA